jgi:periodic tryptophan protein 1
MKEVRHASMPAMQTSDMAQSTQEDEEEREELEIYPTDNLIVTAKTEDDLSQLDIYVYDDAEENLYIHHDLLLPAMPLCLEWLDFPPPAAGEATEPVKATGSYIAVGTLDPEIEIWSLDLLEGMYPDGILGKPPGEDTPAPTVEEVAAPKPGKKKAKKPKKAKPAAGAEYHVDSVLALSWNRQHRSLLASASADCTVKLWDLSLPAHSPALRSFDVHSDKVQALEWNQREPTVLLSGSWDKSVRVFDTRAPTGALGLQTDCDIECVRWNSWEPHEFFVRTCQSARAPTCN